ncbi:MAG: hypothetical protein COA99_14670 [Moraxellaceae bacterium]|nr:MAG: hypothetical protein COA99_14670 [Moraxellaceae bacterium]
MSECHKYVIERDFNGAGNLTPSELHDMAEKSCNVLRDMGPDINWIESYVTDDKFYCVYLAPDAETIREHAEKGGFPVTSIAEVKRMVDPTTADDSIH